VTELNDTLCLKCGLCCNGVIFGDVRQERGDSSPLFDRHGPRVMQPCPAFSQGDCTCSLYADRPTRCRKFECKQFSAVSNGELSPAAALKKIREAKKLAAQIESLLSKLGYNDSSLPFTKRFQRCQREAECGKLAGDQFDQLADLQLAVHRLNNMLSAHFYA